MLSSGSSVSEKPPFKAILRHRKLETEDRDLFIGQMDDVPIVNPTPPGSTPGTTDPGSTIPPMNPTPMMSPPSPTTTGPTITPPSTTTPTTPTIPTYTPPTTPTSTPPTTPTTTPPTTPTTSPDTPTTSPNTPGTTPTNPTPTTPGSSSGGSWCIAKQDASPTALQVALDYACGYGGADCSAIQSGGSCYNPNTVRDHASYAFNQYYQKNPAPTSCDFGGAAQLTNTDPSKMCT